MQIKLLGERFVLEGEFDLNVQKSGILFVLSNVDFAL